MWGIYDIKKLKMNSCLHFKLCYAFYGKFCLTITGNKQKFNSTLFQYFDKAKVGLTLFPFFFMSGKRVTYNYIF